MQKPKTSEAQRRAVANYQEKIDRVNCRFPKGTKQRIEATGSTINAFIIKAVEKELERIEAGQPAGRAEVAELEPEEQGGKFDGVPFM